MNQVIYLEQYIEGVFFLPTELQRVLNNIKALDERCTELTDLLQVQTQRLCAMPPACQQKGGPSDEYKDLMRQVEQNQRMLTQFADEKVQIAQQAYDLLETHALELERTMENFESDMRIGGVLDPDLAGLDNFADLYTPGSFAGMDPGAAMRGQTPKPGEGWGLPTPGATPGGDALAAAGGAVAAAAPMAAAAAAAPPAPAAAAHAPAAAAAGGGGGGAGVKRNASNVSQKAAAAQKRMRAEPEVAAQAPAPVPPPTLQPVAAAAPPAVAPQPPVAAPLPPQPPTAPAPPAATPSATNQGHKKRAQSTNSLMNSMGSLEATEGAAATGGAGAASGLYGAASAGAGGSEAVYGGADLGSAEPAMGVGFINQPPPNLKASAPSPQVPGRLLVESDIGPALKGRHAELWWPDDASWYLIEIQDVDMDSKEAKIVYTTGEMEQLSLLEIAKDQHMSLIPTGYGG